jgi:hypothetical protein
MKTFVSYSWSSPFHEKWVLDLATELRENGVDIVLDKWDLKEGHDSIKFMEEMVTNAEIRKVIIICDKKYAEKADGRDGGVGTETQIISNEVYKKAKQDKFVAIIAEKDEEGKPYLPTYYKSRIYIDLSEPDKYADNFETLIRWIFDKPLYRKPPLGKIPAFLDEKKDLELGTSFAQKRLIAAIKERKENLEGALNEYLGLFSGNIEKFRIQKPEDQEYDDLIFETIDAFNPYKNEFLVVILAMGQYGISQENANSIYRFLESLIHYLDRDENTPQRYTEFDFDVFRFIIQELFLNTIAALLKYEKFECVSILLNSKYYCDSGLGGELKPFNIFQNYLRSFEYRNRRLSLNRLSLNADLIKNRTEGSGIVFKYIMQADFVCYINSELTETDSYFGWYPHTLIYSERSFNGFEIFARAQSISYFNKMKCILNIESFDQLKKLIDEFSTGKRNSPRWEHVSFSPAILAGIEKLATEK